MQAQAPESFPTVEDLAAGSRRQLAAWAERSNLLDEIEDACRDSGHERLADLVAAEHEQLSIRRRSGIAAHLATFGE